MSSITKKRKQTDLQAIDPANRSKKHKNPPKGEYKDKGKGKATEFQVINASLVVSVPPVFASDPRAGVQEMLDSMVMRHVCTYRIHY